MEKICFVACPIGAEQSSERKLSDTLLKHIITPVCEQAGYKVVRVDQLSTVDRIDNTIMDYLDTAALVIVDMTSHNANVFYEFGYRKAIGLPLIPIIKEGENIPFDVSTLRTIKYVVDDLDKVEQCKAKLAETINTYANFDSDDVVKGSNLNVDQTILSIHDKLNEIISLLEQKNDDIIDMVTAQVAKYAQPQQSTEIALMNAILPTLLQNPDALNNFMKLANIAQK